MGSSLSRNSMKAMNNRPLQPSGTIIMQYSPFPREIDVCPVSSEYDKIPDPGRFAAADMDWIAKKFGVQKTTMYDEVGLPSSPVRQKTLENKDTGAHEKPRNATGKIQMDENQACSGTVHFCELCEGSFGVGVSLQCHSIHLENQMFSAILRSKSLTKAAIKLFLYRKLNQESAPPQSQQGRITGSFRDNIQGLDNKDHDGPQRNYKDWINRLEFSRVSTLSGVFDFNYHLRELYATADDLVQEMNEVMRGMTKMVDRMIDNCEELFPNSLKEEAPLEIVTDACPPQANAPLIDMSVPADRNIRPSQAAIPSINEEVEETTKSLTCSQHAPNKDCQLDEAFGTPQNDGQALKNNTTLMDEEQVDNGPQEDLQNYDKVRFDDLFEEMMKSLKGNKLFTRELLSENI